MLRTLSATFGAHTALGPEHVEPFLGDAGGVPPWDLTDAIDSGRTSRSIELLGRMLGAGERHPLQVMAILQGPLRQAGDARRTSAADRGRCRSRAWNQARLPGAQGVGAGAAPRRHVDPPGDRPPRRRRSRPARPPRPRQHARHRDPRRPPVPSRPHLIGVFAVIGVSAAGETPARDTPMAAPWDRAAAEVASSG